MCTGLAGVCGQLSGAFDSEDHHPVCTGLAGCPYIHCSPQAGELAVSHGRHGGQYDDHQPVAQ